MTILPLSEVKARLSELIAKVRATDDEVTVTRKGRAEAVLISQDAYEAWKETLEILSDRALMKEIRRGLKTPRRAHRTLSIDEIFDPS